MQATFWENGVLFWDNGFQEQNEISRILAECWGSLAECILIDTVFIRISAQPRISAHLE